MSNVLIQVKQGNTNHKPSKNKELTTINKPTSYTSKQVEQAIQGKNKSNMLNKLDMQDEVKSLLAKHDLTIDKILDRYKKIVSDENVKYKGGDVVKVLELLSNLHGIGTKSTEQAVDSVVAELQNKPTIEIRQTFINITEKTQEYLEKLEKIEEGEIV